MSLCVSVRTVVKQLEHVWVYSHALILCHHAAPFVAPCLEEVGRLDEGDRWARTLSRYSTCSVCTEPVLQWLFTTHFTFLMRSEASRGVMAEPMLPANPATQCTMQSTKVTDNVPAITLWPAILSAIMLIIVNVNSRSLLMHFLLCDIITLNDWWQRLGMVMDMTHCSRHLISILAHVPCLVNHCLMKVWMALEQVSCLWRTLTKWITLVIGLRSFFLAQNQ